MEFAMPHDYEHPVDGFLRNRPAVWFLNAHIPLTAQYGCNCWPDCGELDVFEVLNNSTGCLYNMYTTMYSSKLAGGDTAYFVRPVDRTLKVAVVFHEETATVSMKELHHDGLTRHLVVNDKFPKVLMAEHMTGLMKSDPGREKSLFKVPPNYANPNWNNTD